MAKKRNNRDKIDKDAEKKLYAFLATFFTIIGFVIALLIKRNDKYVMFYAKQGLVLFIGQIIGIILGWLPFIGFIEIIYWIFWVILWIIAWLNSLSGIEKNTFLIGALAGKIEM